ncbi:MAG: lysylphosphatidylglycerol synthase transmembrane domain-containing protein [candidate division KSB1 bacterium]|nr:lysylphosphatidylglycerol synthase transmembrane domain-containing protein [candidate division KSB1 bacterium]
MSERNWNILESKARPKRNLLITILKFTISAALVAIILNRIGLDSILFRLRHANWWYVLIGIVCFAVSNIMGSFQWFLLLRSQDIAVRFRQVLSYYHVGLFFNNFLLGYVGGDAFRIYDITKTSGNSTAALSTVIFDRFIGFLSLTSMALIVALIGIQLLTVVNTVYFIAIIMAAWLLGLYLLFNEKAARFLIKHVKHFIPSVVFNKTRDVYKAINYFRHKKGLMTKVLVVSLCVQALRVIVHFWAARAVGVETNVMFFFMFVPIIAMAASLPISMGGIGVREQSGVSMFASIGVAASQVVSFEFLAYLVAIIATVPGGILFAFRKETCKGFSAKS